MKVTVEKVQNQSVLKTSPIFFLIEFSALEVWLVIT